MSKSTKLVGGLVALLLTQHIVGLPDGRASATRPVVMAQGLPNTVEGQLDETSPIWSDGSYYNVHFFEGVAGQTLTLEMNSDDFDAFVMLNAPSGETIAQVDDSPNSTDALLTQILPETGVYTVIANTYSAGATGRYVLTWELTPSDMSRSEPPDDVTLEQTTEIGASEFSDDNPALVPELTLEEGGMAAIQAVITTEFVPMLEGEIDTLRAQLGNDHPDVASKLSELAMMYGMQGRHTQAETLLLEALVIYRASPDAYSEEEASILESLAHTAYMSGQSEQGDALVSEAATVREEAGIAPEMPNAHDEASLIAAIEAGRGNANPYELASQIRLLATLYLRQGRNNEAETLYQEAIALSRGDAIGSVDLYLSLNYLALLYQAQGRYDEAESLYQEAIESSKRFVPRSDSLTSASSEDISIYEASLQLNSTVPILYNLSGLYRVTGDIAQAINTFRLGLDIEQQDFDFNLASLGEGDRIAYVARLISTLNTLNYVLSLNLDAAPNLPEAKQFALTTLLRRKGRILDAGVSTQDISQQSATPEDLELRNQLVQVQEEISSLTLQPPADLSESDYQTRLTRLSSEANRLQSLLSRQTANVALEAQSVELSNIQAKIPANGVLIEYAVYQPFDPTNPVKEEGFGLAGDRFEAPRYAAYLLFPDGRVEAIDLGDAAEIDAAVQSFVGLLQNRSAGLQRAGAAPTIRTDVVEQVTGDIRSLVFDPIAPYLQDTDHLLISPDGQLNLLPFEALQPEAGGDYLIQQYQISYLNSGRDLLKFDLLEPSANPAVIIANPDYDTAADTMLPTVEADLVANGDRALSKSLSQDGRGTSIRPPFSRPGRRGWGMRADQLARPVRLAVGTESGTANNRRSTELSQLQVGPLPGTAAEAEAIRPLLPNAEIRTEDEATENLLKSVQSPSILHIATHGFFLENVDRSQLPNSPAPITENPLLRSGLALAGFNTRTSGDEDGVFTALEASQLNLSGTQLVVLSACDTGLGDISNGEGVYGLRRAFAIAGAESQLMSLWQVSDFGTQSLMARYYEKLTAGMGRSEALREVQLEMIEQGGQYSHPYYWAAFILAGDWRSLD
ncbi:MAG: CHAT domain-containing protein [Cyanothece sp. SIO2G6]|nr:CHAT domain-containing protein [Cyanothece sp. SIO2G6]